MSSIDTAVVRLVMEEVSPAVIGRFSLGLEVVGLPPIEATISTSSGQTAVVYAVYELGQCAD